MKTKSLKKVLFLLFLLFLFICLIVFFFKRKENLTISTCYAIFKMKIHDGSTANEGSYFLNLIFNGNNTHKFSLVMNGNLHQNGVNYNISRKYILNYEIQDEHFFSKVERIFIDPADQVGEKSGIHQIPKLNQTFVFKVVKLDSNRFLFLENLAPIFICTSQ
ncbi:TPA: hypothetical protein U2I51_003511 [Providencia rettgeri]|nr:hypothetical protein [Providencia rettgeri]